MQHANLKKNTRKKNTHTLAMAMPVPGACIQQHAVWNDAKARDMNVRRG
jgi:hypothetical protein